MAQGPPGSEPRLLSQLTFRHLAAADATAALPEVLALARIEDARPDRQLNVQEDAFYARFFGEDGEVFAAYEGARMVGFCFLGYGATVNALWDPILAALRTTRDACGVCIHSLVHPAWRGLGVGGRLHALRQLHALRRGLLHLLATVHPDNRASRENLLRTGFREVDRRVVYEARLLRALLHKPLGPLRLLAPRVPLCRLPTPIEPLPRLSARLGGPQISIKRDDSAGVGGGGNKSRMLEYLLGDALARGARSVVTRGHALSNHCRQTAAAAARLGLRCHLVLKGAPADGRGGNAFLGRLLGARVTWTQGRDPDAVLREVLARAEEAGEAPQLISYGGAQALGVAAYVEALREIDASGERFERIYVASSSGATQAGLAAGAWLLDLQTRVVGVSVDEPARRLRETISALAATAGRPYALGPLPLPAARIEIDDRALGGGYGVVGEPEREALSAFAQEEGVLLDPVYTGRAAAALLAAVRRREIGADERVLFVHTGGMPSLLSLSEQVLGADAGEERTG